jgi:F0F1-type ATP synthase delta subunit
MINSKNLAQALIKISQSENAENKINDFFKYSQKKNFLSLLPQVKKHIKKERERLLKAKTLIISSKHDISEQEKEEIISLVGAEKDVNVEIIKDESVIGGFSATYDGNIYDGSLRNQITQLRNRLTHS